MIFFYKNAMHIRVHFVEASRRRTNISCASQQVFRMGTRYTNICEHEHIQTTTKPDVKQADVYRFYLFCTIFMFFSPLAHRRRHRCCMFVIVFLLYDESQSCRIHQEVYASSLALHRAICIAEMLKNEHGHPNMQSVHRYTISCR